MIITLIPFDVFLIPELIFASSLLPRSFAPFQWEVYAETGKKNRLGVSEARMVISGHGETYLDIVRQTAGDFHNICERGLLYYIAKQEASILNKTRINLCSHSRRPRECMVADCGLHRICNINAW